MDGAGDGPLEGRTAGGRRASPRPDRLAIVGHEIRGPLGVVLTLSEILLGRDLSPDDRRTVELMRLAGQHVLGVAEDLVAEAGLKARRLKVVNRPFDPAATVRLVAELWSPLADGADRRVEVAIDPFVPAELVSDEQRVRQILFNLVSNATRHAARGRIRLSLAYRRGRFVFAVSDEGGGGAVPATREAFAPGADPAVPGTGLGLWICRRLAEALGGRLDFSGSPDTGTTARLSLPAVPGDRPSRRRATAGPSGETRRLPPVRPAAPTRPAGRGAPATPLAGLSVLVVDDSAVSRMLVTAVLSSFDMQVSSVASGREAEAAVAARRPDLVVLDWSLAGETGAEVMARIARAAGGEPPPVLLLTAETRLASPPGVAARLAKPFSPREIYAAVSAALGVPRAAVAG
jgi:CheY-like chemotaxis protein